MFIIIFAALSVVTLVLFFKSNEVMNSTYIRFIIGASFLFSWAGVALWLIALIERWQFSVAVPNTDSFIESVLYSLVYFVPVSRIALGVFYALPVLLIPVVVAMVTKERVTSILHYATAINLLFFAAHTAADRWITPFVELPVQGALLLTTYGLVIMGLLWVTRKAFGQARNRHRHIVT